MATTEIDAEITAAETKAIEWLGKIGKYEPMELRKKIVAEFKLQATELAAKVQFYSRVKPGPNDLDILIANSSLALLKIVEPYLPPI